MQFSNLKQGKEYRWNVTVNDGEIKTHSLTWSFITHEPPDSPWDLDGSCGDRFVNLYWSKPNYTGGTFIEGYNIYRKSSENGWSLVDKVSNGSLSYNDTTVENGITYFYHLSAVNEAGGSNSTQSLSFIPIGPPTVPVDFNLTASPSSVELNWNTPEDKGGLQTIQYEIYRGDDPSDLSLVAEVEDTSYTDVSVEADKTYYYQLTAVNEEGKGEPTKATKTHTPTFWEHFLPIKPFYFFTLIIIILVLIVVISIISKKSCETPSQPYGNKGVRASRKKESGTNVCPDCKRTVLESDPICPHCGAFLRKARNKQRIPAPTYKSSTRKDSKSKKCPNCGLPLVENSFKCPRCGALTNRTHTVEVSQKEQQVPAKGKKEENETKFCRYCGAEINRNSTYCRMCRRRL